MLLGIGTLKGAWFARSNDEGSWEISGPMLKGWEVSTLSVASNGDILAATASSWYGAAIHRSSDLKTWAQVVDGPAYESDMDRPLKRVWTMQTIGGLIYAGVADAGLFSSTDDAASWQLVDGLTNHPSAGDWSPGLGGLALHRIVSDGADPNHLWVAISAVGVFESRDAGQSWDLRNSGVPAAAPSDGFDIGYCVHNLVNDPNDANVLWRQDHRGVFRTSDGGRRWDRIQNGVPGAGFGFPIVRDPNSGALFIVPLESDEYRMPVDGHLCVYRSTDGGESWHATSGGLPAEPTHTGVLRDSMAVDGNGGVYFGTTGGEVWHSADIGENWRRLPITLPRVTSVQVLAA